MPEITFDSPIRSKRIISRCLVIVATLYRSPVFGQINNRPIRRTRGKLSFVLRVVFVFGWRVVFVLRVVHVLRVALVSQVLVFESVRVVRYARAVVVRLDVGGCVEVVDVTVLPIEV